MQDGRGGRVGIAFGNDRRLRDVAEDVVARRLRF